MRGRARLLAEGEEDVNRAGVRAACTRASRDLARLLDRAGDPIGSVVGRHARCAQDDLGVEAALEQQLRGVVSSTRNRGQQMRRRRLLPALTGSLLGDTPELSEVGIAARERSVLEAPPSG